MIFFCKQIHELANCCSLKSFELLFRPQSRRSSSPDRPQLCGRKTAWQFFQVATIGKLAFFFFFVLLWCLWFLRFETTWLYAECYTYRRMREAFELSDTLKGEDFFQV